MYSQKINEIKRFLICHICNSINVNTRNIRVFQLSNFSHLLVNKYNRQICLTIIFPVFFLQIKPRKNHLHLRYQTN